MMTNINDWIKAFLDKVDTYNDLLLTRHIDFYRWDKIQKNLSLEFQQMKNDYTGTMELDVTKENKDRLLNANLRAGIIRGEHLNGTYFD